MEGICLEALLSGIISKADIVLISEETNIVYVNEKPIILNDKYTLITCSGKERFDFKQNKTLKLEKVSEIETN